MWVLFLLPRQSKNAEARLSQIPPGPAGFLRVLPQPGDRGEGDRDPGDEGAPLELQQQQHQQSANTTAAESARKGGEDHRRALATLGLFPHDEEAAKLWNLSGESSRELTSVKSAITGVIEKLSNFTLKKLIKLLIFFKSKRNTIYNLINVSKVTNCLF